MFLERVGLHEYLCPFLNLDLSQTQNELLPLLEPDLSEALNFFLSRSLFLRQMSSSCCAGTINLQRSMVSCKMDARHSSSKSYDTPVTNLLISSLLLDTREEAYFESLTNFKKYSLTYIAPYHKLMNSSSLSSLCSVGKNLYRNAFFRMSKTIGTSLGAWQSRHIL